MTSALAGVLPAWHDGRMPESRSRRRFPTAYKVAILAAAAQCTIAGAVGALLRREGWYASHLAAGRAAQRAGTLVGPSPRRGPKPAVVRAQDVAVLERQLARAIARAERAEAIIELHNTWPRCSGRPCPIPTRRADGSRHPACALGGSPPLPCGRRRARHRRSGPRAARGARGGGPAPTAPHARARGARAGTRRVARSAMRRSRAGAGRRDAAR